MSSRMGPGCHSEFRKAGNDSTVASTEHDCFFFELDFWGEHVSCFLNVYNHMQVCFLCLLEFYSDVKSSSPDVKSG